MERTADIYQLLKQDHEEVRQMILQLKSGWGQMGQSMGQGQTGMGRTGAAREMTGSSGSGGPGGMGSDTDVRGGGTGSSPEAGRPGYENRGGLEAEEKMRRQAMDTSVGATGQASSYAGKEAMAKEALGDEAMSTGGEGRFGSQGRPAGQTGVGGGPEWQGNRSTGWQGNEAITWPGTQANSEQNSAGQPTSGQGEGGHMGGTQMSSGGGQSQPGQGGMHWGQTGMGGSSSPHILVSRLENILAAHFEVEERHFYPVLEGNSQTREMTIEAYQDHNNARNVLEGLVGIKAGDQMWMSRLEQLDQMLDRHIRQEEGLMFQAAHRVISEDQAMEIGRRFQQEKQSRKAA